MRALVAVMGSATMLVIGVFALSEQAQQTREAAITNGTNATAGAYNTTTGVFETFGQTAGPGIVLAGGAAVVIIALGVLVLSGSGGR